MFYQLNFIISIINESLIKERGIFCIGENNISNHHSLIQVLTVPGNLSKSMLIGKQMIEDLSKTNLASHKSDSQSTNTTIHVFVTTSFA